MLIIEEWNIRISVRLIGKDRIWYRYVKKDRSRELYI